MEMKLNGWKAVVAILAVAAFMIFKFNMQTEALQTDGVEAIKAWLQRESVRAVLPDMKKAIQNPSKNEEYLSQTVDDLNISNFEIISVTRRGADERIIVRAEVRYKGDAPSEGMDVRYLRMHYSMVAGWRVEREASKWDYYLASF